MSDGITVPVDGSAGARAVDLGRLYGDARTRMTEIVLSLSGEDLDRLVPACPAWTVRGLLSHVVGGAEDIVSGRVAGVPSEEVTQAQLRRHRGRRPADLMALWHESAASLEPMIAAARAWAPVLDVVSHEHDLRGAVGVPGARTSEGVTCGVAALCARAELLPVPVRIIWGDGEGLIGGDGGQELIVRTSRFEMLRWRLGRRSRRQMLQYEWSEDPAAVMDSLAIFGPAAADLIE
jgi:uncharacterized protein (TIGR03083 family)